MTSPNYYSFYYFILILADHFKLAAYTAMVATTIPIITFVVGSSGFLCFTTITLTGLPCFLFGLVFLAEHFKPPLVIIRANRSIYYTYAQ